MKRFISFSGGVESTAMCVLYGGGAKGIWADTGAEHKEMYQRLADVEGKIKLIHPEFEIIKVKGEQNVRGNRVDNLTDYITGYGYMPSKGQRFCTKYFKIIPIDKYLESFAPETVELMIGFNADEEPGKDRTGNLMKAQNVKYSYPLYDDGKDRNECEMILYELGLHPDFPAYMGRGGCKYCPFKEKAEWKALYLFDKETFLENKIMEEGVQDKRNKFFAISMTGASLREIMNEVEREISQWGLEVVKGWYKKIDGSEPCGAFCHR